MGDIPIETRLGIGLSNTAIALTTGGNALDDTLYMGPMYDPNGAHTYDYIQVNKPISVSNLDRTPIEDTMTTIEDVHNRTLYIRDNGGFQFEIWEHIDNDADVLNAWNLKWAADNFPDGVSNATSGAVEYDPVKDNGNTGFISGYSRYNVVLESTIDYAGGTKYLQTILQGVRLVLTGTAIDPQKGNRLTFELQDARDVSDDLAAATLIDDDTS